MEAGVPVGPSFPAEELAPVPARRWKGKIIGVALLLAAMASGLLLLSAKPAPPQTGALKFKLLSPYLPIRTVQVQVENHRAGALILWEPCRVERKETGRVIVACRHNRVVPLRGTNAAGVSIQSVLVELMGTNRGPWRLLVPVARYEWLARLEGLLGKGTGSLVMRVRPLEALLRRARTWVASEWFDEPSAGTSRGPTPGYPFPMPGGPGPTMHAPMFAPEWQRRREESQRRGEDTRTFSFIVGNFYRRYGRWPNNLAELKAFADAKGNFQPEMPGSIASRLEHATFTTKPDGGLTITHQNGSMSFGPTAR